MCGNLPRIAIVPVDRSTAWSTNNTRPIAVGAESRARGTRFHAEGSTPRRDLPPSVASSAAVFVRL
jgi:hypothetical protein